MTDEEKKSIEIIKFLQDKCIQENGTGVMYIYRIDDLANAIKILLNLIEKQSKEIEELFAENQSLKYTNGNMIHKDVVRVNYTSNDKIKAKIERKF